MMSQCRLADTDVSKIYRIQGFEDSSSAYADKLRRMGFTAGTTVEHVQGASHDPQVFFVRGSRVALRKSEAKQVFVEELK
jgi:ferrous iron transport protein A